MLAVNTPVKIYRNVFLDGHPRRHDATIIGIIYNRKGYEYLVKWGPHEIVVSEKELIKPPEKKLKLKPRDKAGPAVSFR